MLHYNLMQFTDTKRTDTHWNLKGKQNKVWKQFLLSLHEASCRENTVCLYFADSICSLFLNQIWGTTSYHLHCEIVHSVRQIYSRPQYMGMETRHTTRRKHTLSIQHTVEYSGPFIWNNPPSPPSLEDTHFVCFENKLKSFFFLVSAFYAQLCTSFVQSRSLQSYDLFQLACSKLNLSVLGK